MAGTDYLTEYGAGVLAMMIETHWRERGFAGIRVARYQIPGTEAFGVRSNIGPTGYPPRDAETVVVDTPFLHVAVDANC